MADNARQQNGKHRHRRSHRDSAEQYKQHVMRSKRRNKIFGNALFVVLSVLAILILAFTYYIYTTD